jgi:hypothetical protein
MIGLIVLRPQRFEVEVVCGERGWWIEAGWHELVSGHDRDRTGLASPPARADIWHVTALDRPDRR